jgi:hypothetical protein
MKKLISRALLLIFIFASAYLGFSFIFCVYGVDINPVNAYLFFILACFLILIYAGAYDEPPVW